MNDIKFSSLIHVSLIRGFADDRWVEQAARISTRHDMRPSRNDGTMTGGLIKRLMADRHGTPFEHGGTFTFRVHAPIFVFREWQRHRVGWSYNEQSGRYSEFMPMFYVPPENRLITQVGKPMDYQFEPGDPAQCKVMNDSIRSVCADAWDSYQRMLAAGIAREVARNVLPVTTYSSMYATCNPRSLMHFLSLRTSEPKLSAYPSHPQWEIEQAARQMEMHFKDLMPVTWAMFDSHGRVAP